MADKGEEAPAAEKPCHAMFHVSGADGEVTFYPADKETQERWEQARQLILAKQAEYVRSLPPRESPPPGSRRTIIHYRELSWFGFARKMWRALTEEPGGVLWETGTDRRRSFGVKRCGWR